MAWSPEKVRLLKMLHRSMWSMEACGLALGMTRMACLNKLKRLSKTDAEIELVDLQRKLWREAGRRMVTIDDARALLAGAGVKGGLAVALGGNSGSDAGSDAGSDVAAR